MECKALSVLNWPSERNTQRRAKLIEKDIGKGLRQLRGAIRNLQSRYRVINQNGQEIKFDFEDAWYQGIVLVSEMYAFVDWKEIAHKIKSFSNPDRRIFLHVIDIAQLEQICIFSPHPLVLSDHLLDRFLATLQHKNAFVKTVISSRE